MKKEKVVELHRRWWDGLAKTGMRKDQLLRHPDYKDIAAEVKNMDANCAFCEWDNQQKGGNCENCPLCEAFYCPCCFGYYNNWEESEGELKKMWAEKIRDLADTDKVKEWLKSEV